MPEGFLILTYPAPTQQLDLKAWRRFEGQDKKGGYAAFGISVDEEKLIMHISPGRRVIDWDDSETIGYTSMNRQRSDAKVQTDYFGNKMEEERMPGPFEILSDEAELNIDPRKKEYQS